MLGGAHTRVSGGLHALISTVLDDLARRFDHEVPAPPHVPVLGTCANFLWHIKQQGSTVSELQLASRTTRRTVEYALGRTARWGWTTIEEHGPRRVVLTTLGAEVAGAASSGLAAAERAWAETHGSHAVKLRRRLEQLVAQFDLELAHAPIGYGPADCSVAGGSRWFGTRPFDVHESLRAAEEWEQAGEARLHVAHAGQEWRPVSRAAGDTLSDLPVYALAAQTLLALSLEYEQMGGAPLALAANVLRTVPDEGICVRLRRAPSVSSPGRKAEHWIAALLERHGMAYVDPDPAPAKTGLLTLTEKGARMRDAYVTVPTVLERRWDNRYGVSLVGGLRESLEAVVAAVRRDPVLHPLLADIDIAMERSNSPDRAAP